MKLLLLSDTQTDRSNLQESDAMLKHLLQLANQEKPDIIIHCGDAKESYDPISLVVVKWWVRATKRIVSKGHRFIILKGNHDRISQSAESLDWLDILAAAGAEVVTQPKVKDGIAFLPYTGVAKQEIEWADRLIQEPARVLIFHTAVAEGVANGFSGLGHTTDTLHFDKYDACFGGHYHGYQKLGKNAWYVGSPFCHSWGEANESKGFLLATVNNGGIKIKRFRSRIPGWYDAEWLEQHHVQPEANAYIRSRVPVTSKKISLEIQKEEDRLKELYPKARLHVVPKVIDADEPGEFELTGETDREKIEQYVAATFPEGAKFKPSVAVGYLSGILKTTGHSSSHHQIRAINVRARNVLCFEEFELPLDNQGLVLIQGQNKDWSSGQNKSNGAGKSSALSLIPIALYGRNMKGQTHDAWARESTDKTARVNFTFQNEKKQEIEVERTRRPHGIILRINGEDMSTGLKGIGKNETQGVIEALYTDFQTLINSVYVDQSVANSFLYGTQKDRMDLMSKIISMERYETGLKQTTKELTKQVTLLSGYVARTEQIEESIDYCEHELTSFDQLIEVNWAKKKEEADQTLQLLQKEHTAKAAVSQMYTQLQEELDEEIAEMQNFNLKLSGLQATLAAAESAWLKAQKQLANKTCPTCGQPVPAKVGQAEVAQLKQNCKDIQQQILNISTAKGPLAEKIGQKNKKIQKYDSEMSNLKIELDYARKALISAEEGAKAEAEKNQLVLAKKEKYQLELKQYQLELKVAQRIIQRLSIDIEMLEYAKKAFQRNGMPLMLCRSTCKVLNKAAEFYSELFFDSKQGIRFSATTEEFVVDVINGSGSETIEGQSTGEGAMAGIVAAFALIEACPKSNLLIIDEPGAGLDPEGAKSFARGLIQLKKRFSTILVTTHNLIIAAELTGERQWTIIKENGISRLQVK